LSKKGVEICDEIKIKIVKKGGEICDLFLRFVTHFLVGGFWYELGDRWVRV